MQYLLYSYYMLMSISFGISIFCIRKSDKNIFIFLLLLFSIVVETIVRFFLYQNQNHFILYHFFTPFEYMFISLYCLKTLKFPVAKIAIIISIIFFWVLAVFTFFSTSLSDFPTLMNSVECFFLVIISTVVLLNIEPVRATPIYFVPEFWIALAILIFFTGTFFLNGTYNYLRNQDASRARVIFTLINSIFNCLFYTLLSYGLICYYKYRKYN